MLKAVTRQNRSAPQLAKRLSPTKDSLGAPSLKSVDEDVEVAIGSASQELLEQLQVFADEDEEKWEAMRQIVGLGLESISGSVLALISRIADELQLSLREKLKEGIDSFAKAITELEKQIEAKL
jgi:DNA-directed RNA polymerase subunit L